VKTPAFEYHAPDTLEEALALLAEHGDEAKVLAGGQSLVPLLAMRLARPSQLVDINGIAALGSVGTANGGIGVGAIVRERDAERSAEVAARVPLLAEALPFIGHVAIRNRGTIGGSLAHADASAELPCVAVATEASVVVRSAARGERTLAAEGFLAGHFTHAMDDDECLVEVRFPTTPAGAGWSFQEVARRHGDFALVGVGAMVRLDGGAIAEARIALMGVADRAVRARAAEAALVGAAPGPETFAAAAQDAVADLEPASDVHGSAAFRKHLAGVTVRRALTTAAERAS
jgi:carbon-monoxide dehydrogenase medium subunit